MPDDPVPGDDPVDVDDDPDSGTHPDPDEPDAPADATPPADGDDDQPDDHQPDGTEDDEPEEYRYLADRFKNIDDPRERKAAIGRTYIEKTRFAKEMRLRAEEAEAELEKLRAERGDKDEPSQEPPEKTPDVQRLDARIATLNERAKDYSERQEEVLADLRETNNALAVAKHEHEQADEADRRAWEREIRTLERDKKGLTRQFSDLATRVQDVSDSLDEVQRERDWTIKALSERRSREANERITERQFQQEFPNDLLRDLNDLADELKLPKDKDVRTDLKETALPRIAMALWKAGAKGLKVERVDLESLVESEVKRYAKRLDREGRMKFNQDSRERIDAARGKEGARPPARRDPGSPAPKPKRHDPLVPIDVTALGIQDMSPSMVRARKHLADRGY